MRYSLNQVNFDADYTKRDLDYDLDILEICFLDKFVSRYKHIKRSKILMKRLDECGDRIMRHIKEGLVIGVNIHAKKDKRGRPIPCSCDCFIDEPRYPGDDEDDDDED